MKRLLIIFLFSSSCGFLLAQESSDSSLISNPTASYDLQWQATYAKAIRLEYIDGQYIPKDLKDVFIELDDLIEAGGTEKMKSAHEDFAVKMLDGTLGRWMIKNWRLESGSRISHYLSQIGIYRPEDMVQFLIRNYHRYLNGSELNVKDQLKAYKEKYNSEKLERIANGKVINTHTKATTKSNK